MVFIEELFSAIHLFSAMVPKVGVTDPLGVVERSGWEGGGWGATEWQPMSAA